MIFSQFLVANSRWKKRPSCWEPADVSLSDPIVSLRGPPAGLRSQPSSPVKSPGSQRCVMVSDTCHILGERIRKYVNKSNSIGFPLDI